MTMMNNTLYKKISDSRMNIFMRDPFLGYILQHFNIIVDQSVETAYTNGKHIVLGESFLSKLSLDETIFILLHELLHLVLGHIKRGRHLDKLRFNVACDIVVNDIISLYQYNHGNLTPQFGKDYSIRSLNLTVEEVYKRLPKNIKSQILDFHDLWTLIEESDLEKDNEELQEVIKKAIIKGYRLELYEINRVIDDFKIATNKNNWNRILERYITKDIQDYSFNRTDYRYSNVLLPSFIESEQSLYNCWFLIDVSGSIDNEYLRLIFGEVERIINHYKTISCDVSFFSTMTTKPVNIKNKKSLFESSDKITSTGGTDYEQIFDSIDEYYKNNKPKLMIIFTDGYAEIPDIKKTKNIPIIWCVDDKNMVFPYGKTIYINKY